MENKIKLLHLEDNLSDSQLVQSVLKKANIQFEYFFVDCEEDFRHILETQEIDIILSDYHLPDYSGTEALLLVKSRFSQLPFVFISGTMGEDAAIESLLNGATDYVLKNKMERLVPAVHRAYKEAQDHKARQKAENEIRKLSRAVEQSPNSIIITNVDGGIEYANPTTCKITGYKCDELIGVNPRIFSSGETPKEEYKLMWKAISHGEIWRGEFHNKKKNGELYWESASITPIFSENGEITNYLGIKTDISESKKITAELIASKEHAEESDRLKSAFLANMSHEIRTPMNGILGFAELLKTPGLSGEQQQEYIKIIEKSGARMLNIINDIVDISKIESGLMQVSVSETRINEQTDFINNFFKPQAESKGLKISFKNGLNDQEASIKTDHEKVYAILINLVKNAIKYTFKGSIEFGYVLNTAGKQAELEFYVKDTGIGIPTNRQDAIFERFIQADIADTRAYQGAGLGLSIAKAYVEMLGGKIWVESKEGFGSVFYFTIPYSPIENEHTRTKKFDTKNGIMKEYKKLKILVTDDDEVSEMLISIAFKDYTSEIIKAENGVEAVAACRQHPDIDLVMMDIKMPVMDGYEATRKIRQFNNDVIIIAQTAFALVGDKEDAMAAGCNDYISKPLDVVKLREVMLKHFK